MARIRSRLDALARRQSDADRPPVYRVAHLNPDGSQDPTDADLDAWAADVRASGGRPVVWQVRRVNAPPAPVQGRAPKGHRESPEDRR